MFQSEREKHVGVSQSIVIEKIPRAGAKVRNIECPALERDREAELSLLVALAV